MRILFLVYHGFSDHSGISKKIQNQVKGLRQNEHEVHLCYYDRGDNGHWQRLIDNGEVLEDFGCSKLAGLRQRISYDSIYNYCVDYQIQMVYARCFQNANPWLVHFFSRVKKIGVKAVMEIPTYPYDQESEGFSRIERLQLRIDQLFRKGLARQLEAIVTFTNKERIFGQRTIRISNGVDLDSTPLLSSLTAVSDSLHLIGVAEVHYWHGYDRLIAGLGEYYQNKSQIPEVRCKREVFFHIVGGVWKSEMYDDEHAPGFSELIKKYGIEDKVIFHGQLFGEELNAVFAQCNFAVGSLARHRCGISDIKTLKNREYASRGLPFVYSENDSDFDSQPYVLKVPADETPIDIADIISFVEQLHVTPQEIRKSVEHLSWKVQMQRVVEEIL